MIVMGVGTFVVGPLSDTFGRRKVIIIGLLFYIAMGVLAFVSSSLEIVLAALFLKDLELKPKGSCRKQSFVICYQDIEWPN